MSPITAEQLEQELKLLVEAYADAKTTQNTLLMQFATERLGGFISAVEITLRQPAQGPADDFLPAEVAPVEEADPEPVVASAAASRNGKRGMA